ncbi:MAG TPA: PhzF family isomerase [Deltaproteobacteria bacterium]|nr:PhzF family isomerase [Deltaproteobacteria bacterium]
MSRYRIYQVDAFTKNRFEGNPAGVVANADGLTESQMQAIARELNNAETAFILSPSAPDHDVWIRFFTPTTEVPSCGHATISAHYVRAMENDLPSCTIRQRIGIGILPVDIIQADSGCRIIMTQGGVEISDPFGEEIKNDILGALGLSSHDLDQQCPVQIASTGHSKVMVGIRSRDTLNSLQPDLGRLTDISREIGCNGYFVFTLDSDDHDILTHGRMFAPAIGIPEDPVTGNANGPLGAYLVHHHILEAPGGSITFRAKQGEALGRPGIVTVTVEVEDGKPCKVQVGGDATIAFRTEMEL